MICLVFQLDIKRRERRSDMRQVTSPHRAAATQQAPIETRENSTVPSSDKTLTNLLDFLVICFSRNSLTVSAKEISAVFQHNILQMKVKIYL